MILRPGIVIGRGGSPLHWGVGMWWHGSVCQVWGSGENKLPLVLVEDVAKALVAALHASDVVGRSFNLVGPPCLSAKEYLAELDRCGGFQIQRHYTPIRNFYATDMFKWLVKVLVRHPERQLPSYRDWESRTQRPLSTVRLQGAPRLASFGKPRRVRTARNTRSLAGNVALNAIRRAVIVPSPMSSVISQTREIPILSQAVAIVVIGRNEGDRLQLCLRSVLKTGAAVVYVDSGSVDGSPERAASMGIPVVHLDASRPFSAARGRNEGFAWVAERSRAATFVQFLDGDCEMAEDWLAAGLAALIQREDVAIVCGHVHEQFPRATVYNRLCELEWDTKPGEIRSSEGGSWCARRLSAPPAVSATM